MMNAGKKHRILCLLDGTLSPDPWTELASAVPPDFQVEALPLLQANSWQDGSERHPLEVILVDIDTVARTEPLDVWAIQAWRATFNELVARGISAAGKSPLLLGYTREPNWERAVLGVQLGARDLVKLSRLNEHLFRHFGRAAPELTELFPAADRANADAATNVVKFTGKSSAPVADAAGDAPTVVPPKTAIPKHVIPFPIEGLDGESLAVEGVRELIRRTAPLDTPVLIVGPTGSGKELVARSIHKYSARRTGPFVTLNCGAISPHLIEAELFGHVKGAYTDATQDNEGVIRSAHGGTLFLDEIAQLTPDVQVKLLRAVQEKKVTPVGTAQGIEVDIRLVSATQEDLNDRVRDGKFREDLLFRIRVIELALPSLAERKSDIPEIAKVVLKKLARKHKRSVPELNDAAMEKFLLHAWPGNIRELENALEHAATLAWAEERFLVDAADLPESIRFAEMPNGKDAQLKDAVRRFEREYIAATIRRLGGSKEAAAENLGLSLATLYRKLGG